MRRGGVVVLGLMLVAAACGGGESAGVEPTTDLEVAMTDFAFEPADAAIPAGADITVTLDNIGSIEHDWLVFDQGIRIEAEADLTDDETVLDTEWVYVGEHLQPGDSSTVTFTAPAAGVYQIICAVPGHFSAGMRGELTVVGSP